MRQEALKEKMPALRAYFKQSINIATVYLYGSFGTSRYVSGMSDLDLAILYCQEIPLMQEMKICADISVLLERENVDTLNLNRARVDLCHEVLLTGEIIYEREPALTADFVERTLQYYFDYGIPLRKVKLELLDSFQRR